MGYNQLEYDKNGTRSISLLYTGFESRTKNIVNRLVLLDIRIYVYTYLRIYVSTYLRI